MKPNRNFLWVKILFMLGSLAAVLYTMSYFRSGGGSHLEAAMGTLIGVPSAPPVDRSAKIITHDPDKNESRKEASEER